MDSKVAWQDNVFVERIWRTIKYEEVYLRACAGVSEARAWISRYLSFYHGRHPHSSLDAKMPDQAYFNLPMPEAEIHLTTLRNLFRSTGHLSSVHS